MKNELERSEEKWGEGRGKSKKNDKKNGKTSVRSSAKVRNYEHSSSCYRYFYILYARLTSRYYFFRSWYFYFSSWSIYFHYSLTFSDVFTKYIFDFSYCNNDICNRFFSTNLPIWSDSYFSSPFLNSFTLFFISNIHAQNWCCLGQLILHIKLYFIS